MKSDLYECIYIHIPKTAGTSIGTLLGAYEKGRRRGDQDHRTIQNIQDAFTPSGIDIFSPRRWGKYANQNFRARRMGFENISKNEFDSYFKFAIVRNPWDRVYSWYRNVIRDPMHLKAHCIGSDISFDFFIENCMDSWALRSQLSWIKDGEGDVIVDFVGRFENLEEDIDKVKKKIGADHVTLPHELFAAFSESYLDAYNDRTYELVGSRYA